MNNALCVMMPENIFCIKKWPFCGFISCSLIHTIHIKHSSFTGWWLFILMGWNSSALTAEQQQQALQDDPSGHFHQSILKKRCQAKGEFQYMLQQRFPWQRVQSVQRSSPDEAVVHSSSHCLTPGQRQRRLQRLQVVLSLCDHHTDGILKEEWDETQL